MIAIDTNILIYAHRSHLAEHAPIQRALERVFATQAAWGIPAPCVAEFWSVVTHPAVSSRPSTPAEASAFLTGMLAHGHGAIVYPDAGFDQRLLHLARKLGARGNKIFDLQIATIAQDNGASVIWTCDRHFPALPGLRVCNPVDTPASP